MFKILFFNIARNLFRLLILQDTKNQTCIKESNVLFIRLKPEI
jgi:hypothetical protein